MRVRRFIAGGLVAGALFVMAAGPAGAANITYTPSTITYGTTGKVDVSGLTPAAAYTIQIYTPTGVPLIPGGLPFSASRSGTYTTLELTPDPTDLPGTYLFEVTGADGKVVARTTPTLTGTNTYYRVKRMYP